MLGNAVIVLFRSAVTAHTNVQPKCEDLFTFAHQKEGAFSVMLQYTLPTHQNNPFFGKHYHLVSVVLLIRSCIVAFKQLMGQQIPLLQYSVNIHLCFDNTYILSSQFSIWVHLCTPASAKNSCFSVGYSHLLYEWHYNLS